MNKALPIIPPKHKQQQQSQSQDQAQQQQQEGNSKQVSTAPAPTEQTERAKHSTADDAQASTSSTSEQQSDSTTSDTGVSPLVDCNKLDEASTRQIKSSESTTSAQTDSGAAAEELNSSSALAPGENVAAQCTDDAEGSSAALAEEGHMRAGNTNVDANGSYITDYRREEQHKQQHQQESRAAEAVDRQCHEKQAADEETMEEGEIDVQGQNGAKLNEEDADDEQEEEWEQSAATFAAARNTDSDAGTSKMDENDEHGAGDAESNVCAYSKEFLLSFRDELQCKQIPEALYPWRMLRNDLAENIGGGKSEAPQRGGSRPAAEKSTPTPRRSSSGSLSRSDTVGRESNVSRSGGRGMGGGGFQDTAAGSTTREVRTVSVGRTKSDGADAWAKQKQPPPPPGQRQPVSSGGRQSQANAASQLHKTENRYTLQNVQDDEEAKQRRFKASLNKITPENYDRLFAKITEEDISSAESLKQFITQVIDKSLMEPKFCELYAKLCEDLSAALPTSFGEDENGKPLTFKRILLNNCQKEFEHGDKMIDDAVAGIELNGSEEELSEPKAKTDDPKLDKILCKPKSQVSDQERKYVNDSIEFKKKLARRRKLGLMQFIGELYKHQLLNAKIILRCVSNLLGLPQTGSDETEPEWPDDERVEALCKLLSTIGDKIDVPNYQTYMDSYFKRMQQIADERRVDSRRRFMILDTLDLRKNGWKTAKSNEGPKKIEDVHRDARRQMAAGSTQPAAPRGASRAPPGAANPSRNRGVAAAQTAATSQQPARRSALDGPPPRQMNTRVVQATAQLGSQSQRQSTAAGGNARTAQEAEHSQHEAPAEQIEEGEYVESQAGAGVGTSGVSDEELGSKRKSMLSYLYDDGDVESAANEISSWNRADAAAENVKAFVIDDGFDRKDIKWDLLSKLLRQVAEKDVYSKDGLLEGLRRVLNELPDAVCDLPTGPKHVGQVAAGLLLAGVVNMKALVDELEHAGVAPEYEGEEPMYLTSEGLAVKVLASTLLTLKDEVREEKARELAEKAGGTKALKRLAGPSDANDSQTLAYEYGLTWLEPMIPVREALRKWRNGEGGVGDDDIIAQLQEIARSCGEDAARDAAVVACSAKPSPAEGVSEHKAIIAAPLHAHGVRAADRLGEATLDGIVDAWSTGPAGGKAGELRKAFDTLLETDILPDLEVVVQWIENPNRNHGAASLREVGGSWKAELEQRLDQAEEGEDDEDDDDLTDI